VSGSRDQVREAPVRNAAVRVAAAPTGPGAPTGRRPRPRARDGVALVALVAFSAWLRWPLLRTWLWVDEGLTAGVASHPLGALPRLLRQDGSPPLYYVVLHLWVRLFGTSEVALHAFSLLAALALIPVGLWAGWSLVSRRVGWALAVLVATNPFLTKYSGEARQYSLLALLALVMFATYGHAFVLGRRSYLAPFAGALALALYTHNWSLYLAVALFIALPLACLAGRPLAAVTRDAVVGFGLAGLVFLPWLPTLAFQARHTGAPWSPQPGPFSVPSNVLRLLGTYPQAAALATVTAVGLVVVALHWRSREAMLVATAAVLVLVAPGLSWVTSQWQPNWASRYLAAVVGALLLIVAVALVRLRWVGLVALCVVAILWSDPVGRWRRPTGGLGGKSNVAAVAGRLRRTLRPGDLVLTAQPEQVAVLRYYLGGSFRYATPMGLVPDPQVFDWRDAEARLRQSSAANTIALTAAVVSPGFRLALVAPVGAPAARAASWVRLFYQRADEMDAGLRADAAFSRLARVGSRATAQSSGSSVWAEVFLRHG
jgi:mannosyltransferase